MVPVTILEQVNPPLPGKQVHNTSRSRCQHYFAISIPSRCSASPPTWDKVRATSTSAAWNVKLHSRRTSRPRATFWTLP